MNDTDITVQDPVMPRSPKIVAIGGGKGGVGKTVLAASIGMGLAMLKRQVVCIDADFAGANLRSALGIRDPEKTYADFLLRGEPLESVLTPYTGMESLRILCGADGAVESSQMPHAKKEKLIRHLRKLDADFIVIDLGAGSHYAILDLFLEADLGIVLINPDPLSILESYNFVKQSFYRKLLREFHPITRERGDLQVALRPRTAAPRSRPLPSGGPPAGGGRSRAVPSRASDQ
jgi:flagellar biosynthesis protein FlhG